MAYLIYIAIAVVFVLFFLLWALNFKKVGPSQVLVISGRKSTVTEPDGKRKSVGYRLQVGGGTFVVPLMEQIDVFPVEVLSLSLKCPEVLTAHGVLITAEAQAQVKPASVEPYLHVAIENFLSKGASGMTYVAQEVLEGHIRAILGTMAVEEIYSNREEFAGKVREGCLADFSRMGLELVSFSLKDISDAQGYLKSLGARRIAEVKRDATIAQAETERDSQIQSAEYRKEGDVARLKAEAELAAATRDFEIQRAEFQTAVNVKRAESDIAYDLERAKISETLKRKEYEIRLLEKELAAKIEEKEAVRREKELYATVKLPAEAMKFQSQMEVEADAYKKELEAKGRAAGIRAEGSAKAETIAAIGDAEAKAMREKAKAWKEYTESALADKMIDKLPELARAVSEPLSKVDKIIMVGENQGAQKITGQVASVLAQLPDVVQNLTGIDLKAIIAKKLGQSEEKPQQKENS
jgi:flotillin